MRKTLVPLLLAGLGVSIAIAPAAQATTRDVSDPTGDVTVETWDASDQVTRRRDAGAELDVVFMRVQHTATQVIVYTRYRALSVPQQYGSFSYGFQGNNRKRAGVDIMTRHAQPQGVGSAWASNGRRCPFSYRINYATDSVSMRISRGCLDQPKYARLSQVSSSERFPFDGSSVYRSDSATRDGGTQEQGYASFSPWVVTG